PTASRRRRRRTLDLRAMHDAARRGIEGVAAVHGGAVIPEHDVARAPAMRPDILWPAGTSPELVEERLRLRKLEAGDIGVAAAAEIEIAPPGVGMDAHQRMDRPRRRPGIVACGEARAHIAAAVVGAIMFDAETGDTFLERRGQRLVGRIHAAEAGVAAGRGHFD